MPVEVTNELSPELQKVADLRDHVRKMDAGVEHAKGELKLAKELLEAAQDELNTAIDELIDHEKSPTLFSGLGDTLADEPEAPRTVVTEPAGDAAGDLVIAGAIVGAIGVPDVLALPAGPTDESAAPDSEQLAAGPGLPTRDQFPPDRTGAVEFRLAVFEWSRSNTDQEGKADKTELIATNARIAGEIAKYRIDCERLGRRVPPEWGMWSELAVGVTNAAGVSVNVEVLYQPNHDGAVGRDHFSFWAPVLGNDGFWSCVEQHPIKGGEPQYPAGTLVERAAALAQGRADAALKEAKKEAREARKQKKGA